MAAPAPGPPVPPADQLRYTADCRTRWSDVDKQGVLNNAVYLTLLEEARYQYCEHLGLLGGADHFAFVLAQTEIVFLAPGHGPAAVQVQLSTTRLGNRSLSQAYRVLDTDSGTVWAEAVATLVVWDNDARASAEMPKHFRSVIAEFEELP
jgi:acyl-CoA thioester hydrolase